MNIEVKLAKEELIIQILGKLPSRVPSSKYSVLWADLMKLQVETLYIIRNMVFNT